MLRPNHRIYIYIETGAYYYPIKFGGGDFPRQITNMQVRLKNESIQN